MDIQILQAIQQSDWTPGNISMTGCRSINVDFIEVRKGLRVIKSAEPLNRLDKDRLEYNHLFNYWVENENGLVVGYGIYSERGLTELDLDFLKKKFIL